MGEEKVGGEQGSIIMRDQRSSIGRYQNQTGW
jgi:hypothetical protein